MPEQIISNTFESVLRDQRKGKMMSELSDKLAELTRSCAALGKSGSLTLKIKLTPANGDASAFNVQDSIEIKAPQEPQGSSLFFRTDEGMLCRNNPDQYKLDLKVMEPVQAPQPLQPAVNQ